MARSIAQWLCVVCNVTARTSGHSEYEKLRGKIIFNLLIDCDCNFRLKYVDMIFVCVQYRDSLQEINGQQESRVHLPQIELGYIRQLQQDNTDLRTLLEEHQAALQMIMTKYRQQVVPQ